MALYIFNDQDRQIFESPPTVVARWLLNKLIIREDVVLRIVETEAYGGAGDQASHAYRGRRLSNAAMFAPPGHLYVYKIYGIHHCVNIVCGIENSPAAVLLRAAEVVSGTQTVLGRRGPKKTHLLSSGPANLALSLGITRDLDGQDILGNSSIKIASDEAEPPEPCLRDIRVGLGKRSGMAALYDWRYGVPNSLALSKKFS